jgi:hypothetical protein
MTLEQTLRVVGTGGRFRPPQRPLFLGNAGTASRFLTTMCTLITGAKTIITGKITVTFALPYLCEILSKQREFGKSFCCACIVSYVWQAYRGCKRGPSETSPTHSKQMAARSRSWKKKDSSPSKFRSDADLAIYCLGEKKKKKKTNFF